MPTPSKPRPLDEVAKALREAPAFSELLAHLRWSASAYVSQAATAAPEATRERLVSLLAKAEARIELLSLLSGRGMADELESSLS